MSVSARSFLSRGMLYLNIYELRNIHYAIITRILLTAWRKTPGVVPDKAPKLGYLTIFLTSIDQLLMFGGEAFLRLDLLLEIFDLNNKQNILTVNRFKKSARLLDLTRFYSRFATSRSLS